MTQRDRIDAFLAEFCMKLDMQPARLSKHGTCAFDYDGAFAIVLEVPAGADMLVLYADLLALPKSRRERLLVQLLARNFALQETDGAVFAIDEVGERVLLCYRQPIERLDQSSFENLIENFAAAAHRHHLELALNVEPEPDERHGPHLGLKV